MPFFRFLIILLISFFSIQVAGQEIVIKGIVVDKANQDPLPFCNIYIPQIKQGLSADVDGRFVININEKTDSILFYYLGYKNEVLQWRKVKRNLDSLVVELESTATDLEEIVVKATKKKVKDTVAIRIYRNVVANKEQNRPQSFQTFQYDEYSRIVGSYYNFNPKLVNRRIVKPFKFIIENYDSTADGRKYVPLLIKEKITSNSYQQDPKREKSVTIASKVSGIEQVRFSEILDIAFDPFDVYAGQTSLSGRGFLLPFSETALLRYKFLFIDSTENEACEWIYHMAFVPITKGDNAFRGEVWVHGPTFGVQRIELELDQRANVNWYTDFLLHQDFTHYPGNGWVMTSERRTTGISLTQKKKSRTLHLEQVKGVSNVRINEAIPDSIWENKDLYVQGHNKKTDDFWFKQRPLKLSYPQERVYFLLDTIKQIKAYKIYTQLGRTLVSGYYRAGPVDIGNYFNLLSWNDIEGYRVRLMTKSNRKLSQKFSYYAYGAYGTEDKRFKYGVTLEYRFPNVNNFIHQIGAVYKDDYQRFSLLNQEFEYDYILNTLLRRRAFTDLVYIKDFSLYHRKQWNRSLTTEASINFKQYQTIPGQIEFTTTLPDGNNAIVDRFRLVVPRMYITYTPGARFLEAGGRQIYLSGKLPRIYLDLSLSSKALGSDFNYQKLGVDIEHLWPNRLGWTRYILSASALLGEIPYPLLYIHQGNENFIFDYRRFSNMREGEYAADKHISLMFEHHFDGLFLNKVPLLKKLQWREVFICKMAYSKLNRDKTSFLNLPPTLTGLDGFYTEIGFGIENIFKVFEGQFTWRLTQQDKPDVQKFVLKVAMNLSF